MLNTVTLKKPAIRMCLKAPGGTVSDRPDSHVARTRVAAPIPVPTKRRLHGGTSWSAMAAAIQLKPHAKASSSTSSFAPLAASDVWVADMRPRRSAAAT